MKYNRTYEVFSNAVENLATYKEPIGQRVLLALKTVRVGRDSNPSAFKVPSGVDIDDDFREVLFAPHEDSNITDVDAVKYSKAILSTYRELIRYKISDEYSVELNEVQGY